MARVELSRGELEILVVALAEQIDRLNREGPRDDPEVRPTIEQMLELLDALWVKLTVVQLEAG